MNESAFFREFTLRISSSLDIAEALHVTSEFVREHIPMDFLGLYYVYEDGGEGTAYAYAVAEAGDHPWEGASPGHPLEPIVRLESESVDELRRLRDEEAVGGVEIQNEGQPHPIILGVLPQLAGYSELKLNLDSPGEELGVLALMRRGTHIYTEAHARLLRSVREPVRIAMSNARRYHDLLRLKEELAEDNRAMHRELEQLAGTHVVGADFGLRQVMDMVRRVAPLDSPVLLLGETGTGKEVIANAIHQASPRRDAPLIRVQCGAIPDALLDSELFGHEKGAFTGALTMKRGRFERAEGGTVFLDEIGELTPDAQVKLLRVLQEREFERLGGTRTLKADVRVIAATHRDLAGMVRQGTFREDLWFRLNVFPIHLPPLRQRRDDILSLVQFFVDRKTRELSLPHCPGILAEELQALQDYDWPGNVRELQNVVERALIVSQGGPIRFPEITHPAVTKAPPAAMASTEFSSLEAVTAAHIRRALEQTRGRVEGAGGAADLLTVNASTLRGKMRRLGIPFGRNALRWAGDDG